MELPSTKAFQWKSLAPLPSRRVYSTLVEAGGQVFAVGGCDDNGVPVDSFEAYSPEADQWASLPAMPTARAGVAVTVLGKRIMVIGGVGADQLPLKVVEMYHTDEGRWRKRSALREAAMGISVTAKNHGIARLGGVAIGHRNTGTCLARIHVRKKVYSKGLTLFYRNHGLGRDRSLEFSSLQPQRTVHLSIFSLHPAETVRWGQTRPVPRGFITPKCSSQTALPPARGSEGRGLLQGWGPQRTQRALSSPGGWMKMERSCYLKKRRADFVAGYLRGRVVVAGGLGNQPTVLESAEAFHPEKNKWESLPPMPTPRCACSSIALRDCLLAVGGVSQG
ncbi:KLD8A protein, partial [Chloropsis hardwickii]|nr:KLD8A protein [Chloropsis hardwickii]